MSDATATGPRLDPREGPTPSETEPAHFSSEIGSDPWITSVVHDPRTGSNDGGTPTRQRPPGRRHAGDLPRAFHRAPELHERVRLKNAGGFGEVQTVKVVRNGEGGPKRGWNPATRRSQEGQPGNGRSGWRTPGSGLSGLGALEGRRTSGEDVREGDAVLGSQRNNGQGNGRGPRG
jgi:hypothetical protein